MDAQVTETPEPPRFAGWGERPARGLGSDGPGPPRVPPHRWGWRRWAALGTAGFLLGGASTGWAVYTKLNGNIHTDSATERELRKRESERPPAGPPNAENVLLLGSDSRTGDNSQYGRSTGQRSDTTMLLHLAGDRKSATAVSIPRDLVVTVPHCKHPDATETEPRTTRFNEAFALGGAACTIRTVEELTGIRIDHYLIIDFVGFKKMVDAVDGVEICLTRPVHDREAGLSLPAGRQTLHGEAALGFVRARKSLGNGSDTQRMQRQQDFLGALVKKVQSNGVLLNPTRLYPVLDAATSSLTTDSALASLKGLYELVRSTRSIPTGQVQFMTVPRREYRYDPNRDELLQPDAGRLFGQLHRDLPVTVKPPPGTGEEPLRAGGGAPSGRAAGPPPPSPSSGPAFPGTTAEHGICE
ncbi:LCP family protein [Streptomyces decoyicus]|uniref:LCP family protein n=1 Tax=Streptomyces decoyicus TaxID=249567 RepID=UPI00363434C6